MHACPIGNLTSSTVRQGSLVVADGTTTSCPPLANCNWCGGQSQKDSRGCTTGWRCANGADPCLVSPCTDNSPCKAGESCGTDHLCWPAGAGGTGGKGGATGTGGKGGTGGGGAGGAGGSTGTPVRLCGSLHGIACQSGEFCEYSAEGCRGTDSFGVCSTIPTTCPTLDQPVCGCDGKTYSEGGGQGFRLGNVARVDADALAKAACEWVTGKDQCAHRVALVAKPVGHARADLARCTCDQDRCHDGDKTYTKTAPKVLDMCGYG